MEYGEKREPIFLYSVVKDVRDSRDYEFAGFGNAPSTAHPRIYR